ncbi:type IV pilin protein [Halomonas binhaiensis]|uniref:Prepilin-type N-terminal cleavage/methylation domain-containing protein n=1 Tax=Halomonas binhaiensis TaxID=2562282 RepID=A0A5C1NJI0_9GAMM|nr:type IV pilin protein [Halomonas binhaiensis]QEM83882.1 prepilin-type N-terminal cleavage/methylation domain-containing protein [Halomonas binhaiensis]
MVSIRHMLSSSREEGVTLLELLVVLAITGLLSAIAVPIYRDYLKAARVADGRVALSDAAARLERCYTRAFSYHHASCGEVSGHSPQGYYQVSMKSEAGRYHLTAKALDKSEVSAPCATLVLQQDGKRGPNECW